MLGIIDSVFLIHGYAYFESFMLLLHVLKGYHILVMGRFDSIILGDY